jgi:hypothetical protein
VSDEYNPDFRTGISGMLVVLVAFASEGIALLFEGCEKSVSI